VILAMAWKSLVAHPVRTAVLGIGFGLGVSVMATLLGVGEVVLDQPPVNALDSKSWNELADVISALGARAEVRCLLLDNGELLE